LAVLFSPAKNALPDVFGDFKRTAETRVGLHTVCIAGRAVNDAKTHKNKNGQIKNLLPQLLGNVSMKLNLKLGNINHSFSLADDVPDKMFLQSPDSNQNTLVDTMILGGDVTHPLRGSADPSIAAIVGSVDEHFAKYLGSVRYQQGGTEVCREFHA
jgi:hypothetical protein